MEELVKCNVCGKRPARYFFDMKLGKGLYEVRSVYAECIWCYGIFRHIINVIFRRVK